jgi:hypothetical protein
MSEFVDSLNLRPQEKRIIVVVGVVLFVVLDLVFVQPHFKDYASIRRQMEDTRNTIKVYKSKIGMDNNPNNGFLKQLEKLKKQEGTGASQYKEIQLQNTITAQARASGVNVQNSDPLPTTHKGLTNQADQFFESQSIRIAVQAREEDMVKFLFNIGNDPAMIRVQELDLRPFDANRYQLKGQITLTADYQKSAASKLAPAKTEAGTKTAAKTAAKTTPPALGAAPAPSPRQPPAPTAQANAKPPPNQKAPPPFPTPPGPSSPPSRAGRANQGPPAPGPVMPRRPLSGQRPPQPGNNQ